VILLQIRKGTLKRQAHVLRATRVARNIDLLQSNDLSVGLDPLLLHLGASEENEEPVEFSIPVMEVQFAWEALLVLRNVVQAEYLVFGHPVCFCVFHDDFESVGEGAQLPELAVVFDFACFVQLKIQRWHSHLHRKQIRDQAAGKTIRIIKIVLAPKFTFIFILSNQRLVDSFPIETIPYQPDHLVDGSNGLLLFSDGVEVLAVVLDVKLLNAFQHQAHGEPGLGLINASALL